MGYRTTFTGDITITPPIPIADVQGNPFLDDGTGTYHLCLVLDEAGQAVNSIAAWSTEPTNSGYEAADEFIALVASLPPALDLTGHIRAEGEDWDDQWMMTVRDGAPVIDHVIVLWPDEDPLALQLAQARAAMAAAVAAARAGGPDVARAVLTALGERPPAACT